MTTRGRNDALARASARVPKATKPPRARALRNAWVLFVVIGLPLGLMVALGALAYAGIYVEPLRQFWQPWPPDIVKTIGAATGFAATLGYLTYRKGRSAGYASGAVAERAWSRTRAEGRTGRSVEPAREIPAPSQDPPAPPPEPPIPPSQ